MSERPVASRLHSSLSLILLCAFYFAAFASGKAFHYAGKPFEDSVYHGGPQHIPGRVMCAYYDLGGEGVAYHDSDAKNNGSGTLGHYPKRSAYEFETAQNGPSIAVGGGFDWVVTRPFAWRVLNVEYTHSWMNDVAQIHPQDSLKISTQAVVRIGTW